MRHFYTVPSDAFGDNFLDVNYLHNGCDPAVDSARLDPCPEACVATLYARPRSSSDDPAPSTPAQLQATASMLEGEGFPRTMAAAAADRCGGNAYRARRLLEAACAVSPSRFTKSVPGEAGRVELAHAAMEVLGPACTPSAVGHIVGGSDYTLAQVRRMAARVRRAMLRESAVHADRRYDALLRRANLADAPPTLGGGGGRGGEAGGCAEAGPVGPAWVVLVGGESAGMMFPDAKGTRPGSWLGSHTSVAQIGRAYEKLVPLVGREHIIVIAQLQETIDWLRDCTASPEDCVRVTGSARHLAMFQDKLNAIQRDCACLLASGGADFDGAAVSAETVVRVITGDAANSADRVVPKGLAACGSMLLLMLSHGSSHARRCPARADEEEEHFMCMPYPVSDARMDLFNGIPWRGDGQCNAAEVAAGGRWLPYPPAAQVELDRLASPSSVSKVGAIDDPMPNLITTHPCTVDVHRMVTANSTGAVFPIRRRGRPSAGMRAGGFGANSTPGADAEGCWEWRNPAGAPGTWGGVPDRYRYRLYGTMLVEAYARIMASTPQRRLVVLNHFCLSGGMANFLTSPTFRHIKTTEWPIWCMVTSDVYESSLGDFWHIWIDEVAAACLHPLRHDTTRAIYQRAEERCVPVHARSHMPLARRSQRAVRTHTPPTAYLCARCSRARVCRAARTAPTVPARPPAMFSRVCCCPPLAHTHTHTHGTTACITATFATPAGTRYWQANDFVRQHNASLGTQVDPKRPLSFGSISACEGRLVGDLSMWRMLAGCLGAGPDSTAAGAGRRGADDRDACVTSAAMKRAAQETLPGANKLSRL